MRIVTIFLVGLIFFGLHSTSWTCPPGSLGRLASAQPEADVTRILEAIDTSRLEPRQKQELTELVEHYKNRLPPHILNLLGKRVQKFPAEVAESLKRLSDATKSTGNRYSELYNLTALMVFRGTVKDLVWEMGKKGRAQFSTMELNPTAHFNLFSPEKAKGALDQAIGFLPDKLKPEVSVELERKTGKTLEEFRAEPQLYEIFADEIVSVTRKFLEGRVAKLPQEHSQRSAIKTILDGLDADKRGDMVFQLTGRNAPGLTGGIKAGDCTACGSFNYWAQSAWNGTFEVGELQAYDGKDFFTRFVYIVGKSDGKPALWVHAVEFTPLSVDRDGNNSRLKNPAVKEKNFSQALAYLKEHAKRIGVAEIHLTKISNSYGYTDTLTPLLNRASTSGNVSPFSQHPFELNNPLDSAHAIRDITNPEASTQPLQIYLQGWGASSFRRNLDANVEPPDKPNFYDVGTQKVSRHEVDAASRTLAGLIAEANDKTRRNINSLLDPKNYKKALKNILSDDAPDTALDGYLTKLRHDVEILTQSLNPGDLAVAKKRLERLEKFLRKRVSEIGEIDIGEAQELIDRAAPLIRKFQAAYSDVEVVARVKRALKRDEDYDWPGDDFFKTVMSRIPQTKEDSDSAPSISFSERGAKARWRKSIRSGILENSRSGSWYSRSASITDDLFENLTVSINNLKNVRAHTGEALVGVFRQLDPKLVEKFRHSIAHLPQDTQTALMENMGSLMQYYIDTGAEQQEGKAMNEAKTLSSNINSAKIKID